MASFLQVIEEVNTVISAASGGMHPRISPELGSVVFASATQNWSFTLGSYAEIYEEFTPEVPAKVRRGLMSMSMCHVHVRVRCPCACALLRIRAPTSMAMATDAQDAHMRMRARARPLLRMLTDTTWCGRVHAH